MDKEWQTWLSMQFDSVGPVVFFSINKAGKMLVGLQPGQGYVKQNRRKREKSFAGDKAPITLVEKFWMGIGVDGPYLR